jgi:hypothetical protein
MTPSHTLEIIRFIGSSASGISYTNLEKIFKLYQCSIKNKISLFYLETLKKNDKIGELRFQYMKENEKFWRTLDAITKVSQLLADGNVSHAVYKTIRPYIFTTVDIDILIFGTDESYKKAVKTLHAEGYKLKGVGPLSITLQDPKFNIGIDLYKEVAVSNIIYLDKQKLSKYVITTKLPNGKYVKTLTPEADLATLIAHSIIKEHMFLLSEYYTSIYSLSRMRIQDFLKVATENNITSAVKTHFTITATLHKVAHGIIPKEIKEIISHLGSNNVEAASLIEKNFEMPHKYHASSVIQSFMEIAKGEKTRRSIAMQFIHMLKPKFTSYVLRGLIDHVTRETY